MDRLQQSILDAERAAKVAEKRAAHLEAREDGWRKHLLQIGSSDPPPEPPALFTCDDCPAALECPSAFDDYNTNGDCLEMK